MRPGDYIDQVLEANGGKGTLRWEADLPEGLSCRPWGCVCGLMPDRERCTVRLRARDSRGYQGQRDVPLVLDNFPPAPEQDFRAVPGGFFYVGYHPSQLRDQYLNFLSTQGFPIDAKTAAKECPPAKAHLDGFFIQTFEVTNAQYAQFVKDSGHTCPVHWSQGIVPTGTDSQPVVNVSHDDAQAYCLWKTQKAHQKNLPVVYALPTHLEWEKAAKGPSDDRPGIWNGSARLYPWGDQWGVAMMHDCSSRGQAVDVGLHANSVSPYGVCDLSGNVCEWVDGGEIEEDHVYRHVRGASWNLTGEDHGLTFNYRRKLWDPGIRSPEAGFRCVIRIVPRNAPRQALVPLGDGAYVNGQGQKAFIGPFYISRFAVSNQEFAEFRPDHRFEEPARYHPVTEVTYKDAVAFCQRKAQRINRVVHLPTREEWECAVRGSSGRKYPWADDYCRHFCNSLESGWGRPVDVFALWQGASPEGVYNLVGNTFEWLFGGDAVGGSWGSTCDGFGAPPYDSASVLGDEGRYDIGFRYVVV